MRLPIWYIFATTFVLWVWLYFPEQNHNIKTIISIFKLLGCIFLASSIVWLTYRPKRITGYIWSGIAVFLLFFFFMMAIAQFNPYAIEAFFSDAVKLIPLIILTTLLALLYNKCLFIESSYKRFMTDCIISISLILIIVGFSYPSFIKKTDSIYEIQSNGNGTLYIEKNPEDTYISENRYNQKTKTDTYYVYNYKSTDADFIFQYMDSIDFDNSKDIIEQIILFKLHNHDHKELAWIVTYYKYYEKKDSALLEVYKYKCKENKSLCFDNCYFIFDSCKSRFVQAAESIEKIVWADEKGVTTIDYYIK